MINQKTLTKLEYQRVMQTVAQKARSASARALIEQILPSTDVEQARFLLCQTAEACEYINNAVTPDFSFDDMTAVLEKARIFSTLSFRDLLGVMRLLRCSRIIKSSLSSYGNEQIVWIAQQSAQIYTNQPLEDRIDFCIISQDEINDRASEKLFSIRKKIKNTNKEIRDKLSSYTRSRDMAAILQDSIITMREGRYVIPVKLEYKNAVKGIVHDQSQSGNTVFIEPMAIVNLNNDLRSLMIEENQEIEQILIDFTQTVHGIVDQLLASQNTITLLDSVFAKAHYALDIRAVLPKINDNGYVNLVNARHPLIAKEKVVPVSVSLGKDYNIIVITGPNTGGKTVSLKTIGLFCIMACSGLFLPASDNTEVACFDDIFCDIGDEQSIEQSLSTFSSHIVNIRDITQNVNKNCLVLLDELGAGTEPNEGAALALAITEFLLETKCRAVLTTHYGQLKEFSLLCDGIENASMEFDSTTLSPTYKLVMGIPGSSNAIEIAKRLGLSDYITQLARSKLSSEKVSFEKVLQRAEQVRQENEQEKEITQQIKRELEEQLKKIRTQNELLLAERERLLKRSQVEARQAVAQVQDEAQELLTALKDIVARCQLEESVLFQARGLVKKIKEKGLVIPQEEEQEVFVGEKIKAEKLAVGDTVYVKSLSATGLVVQIDTKRAKASVKLGNMTSVVPIDSLYQSYTVQAKPKKQYAPVKSQIRTTNVKNEINVIGQTVMEATGNIDLFLDQALMAGLKQVQIIHGIGTCKLREGVHRYLAKHTGVAEYRLGVFGEGEGGVTIVKLK